MGILLRQGNRLTGCVPRRLLCREVVALHIAGGHTHVAQHQHGSGGVVDTVAASALFQRVLQEISVSVTSPHRLVVGQVFSQIGIDDVAYLGDGARSLRQRQLALYHRPAFLRQLQIHGLHIGRVSLLQLQIALYLLPALAGGQLPLELIPFRNAAGEVAQLLCCGQAGITDLCRVQQAAAIQRIGIVAMRRAGGQVLHRHVQRLCRRQRPS